MIYMFGLLYAKYEGILNMEEIKYKDYREYLMKEPLKAITIGHAKVTDKERKESKSRIKKIQKNINKRLEELNK
ncbi:MAG: hypothetical protein KH135_00780 [Firmicutes bacterium]|nr:hypothetical protein [Bacillota bacterium]